MASYLTNFFKDATAASCANACSQLIMPVISPSETSFEAIYKASIAAYLLLNAYKMGMSIIMRRHAAQYDYYTRENLGILAATIVSNSALMLQAKHYEQHPVFVINVTSAMLTSVSGALWSLCSAADERHAHINAPGR